MNKVLTILIFSLILTACGSGKDEEGSSTCSADLALSAAKSTIDKDSVSSLFLEGKAATGCKSLLISSASEGADLELSFAGASAAQISVLAIRIGAKTISIPKHLRIVKGATFSIKYGDLARSPEIDAAKGSSKTLAELEAEQALREALSLPQLPEDVGDASTASVELQAVTGVVSSATIKVSAAE